MKIKGLVKELRQLVGEGAALVPPEIIHQVNPWLWPPHPEQPNQALPDYEKGVKYTGTARSGAPATGFGIKSDPLSSAELGWLTGKRGDRMAKRAKLNESLAEVLNNIELVRSFLQALEDSEDVPAETLPDLKDAIGLLSVALDDTKETGSEIQGLLGKAEAIDAEVGTRRLLEQVQDLVMKYKELKSKADELDLDLPAVMKAAEIEWPHDDGDFIRQASHWFPIVRRSLPKAWEVVKHLAKEMAWRGENVAKKGPK